MTYFELLGLPESVTLDQKRLDEAYRSLSKTHHPDRVEAQALKEKRVTLEKTAALNQAYQTLKATDTRLVYVLKLRGIDLNQEGDASRVALPTSFLESIIERREVLEAACESRNRQQLDALRIECEQRQAERLASASVLLEANDNAGAAVHLAELKYFARFLKEIDAFEDNHG
jgi:molecular chaperone HscB